MMNKPLEKSKNRRVTFSLTAAAAEEVYLVGDFNGWDEKKHPMKKDKNGKWKKDIVIPPGMYEYKYIVDGKWQIDPANRDVVHNRFGTLNNIILVESK